MTGKGQEQHEIRQDRDWELSHLTKQGHVKDRNRNGSWYVTRTGNRGKGKGKGTGRKRKFKDSYTPPRVLTMMHGTGG